MKRLLLCFLMMAVMAGYGQTVIPNAGFDTWNSFTGYSNPVGWDTPNPELNLVPFIGIAVVSKGADRTGSGSYSARLETMHYSFPLAPTDVPGFMTCGNLTVDFASGTYLLSGGVPVADQPTHLKGYYKYLPKGGDSCVIGVGLTRTTGGMKDTVGIGYFSTKDTVSDWTPFSAWIDYVGSELPDSMNIIAMSTAQEVMTIGTVLFVDDLYFDYTVGNGSPAAGEKIRIYNDRETKRLMIFFDRPDDAGFSIRLINLRGQDAVPEQQGAEPGGRRIVSYERMTAGVYLLQVVHGGELFTRKVFLD